MTDGQVERKEQHRATSTPDDLIVDAVTLLHRTVDAQCVAYGEAMCE